MSMGRRSGQQTPMWVAATDLSRSQGHRFYEKLNELLAEAGFDRRVEELCAPYFEADGKAGRPSVAPGVYFRMLFVGYFEGIESERGLEWRCSDSLSLRTFLGVLPSERVPDHSTLSRTRTRLDAEVYDAVFRLVLGIVESKGLLRGKVAGVDSTYLRADASMKSIVRKDTGDDYAAYLQKLCEAQGIENPTVEDARRMDRKRKGKKVSNTDWASPTDADARIVRLKDGRTRLGYKAEHVVDLESGAIVVAEVYGADQGDTATLQPSLEAARENIDAARAESKDSDANDDDGRPGRNRRGQSTMVRSSFPSMPILAALSMAVVLSACAGETSRTSDEAPSGPAGGVDTSAQPTAVGWVGHDEYAPFPPGFVGPIRCSSRQFIASTNMPCTKETDDVFATGTQHCVKSQTIHYSPQLVMDRDSGQQQQVCVATSVEDDEDWDCGECR